MFGENKSRKSTKSKNPEVGAALRWKQVTTTVEETKSYVTKQTKGSKIPGVRKSTISQTRKSHPNNDLRGVKDPADSKKMRDIEKRYGPSKSQIRSPTDVWSSQGLSTGDRSPGGSRRGREARSKSKNNVKSQYMWARSTYTITNGAALSAIERK